MGKERTGGFGDLEDGDDLEGLDDDLDSEPTPEDYERYRLTPDGDAANEETREGMRRIFEQSRRSGINTEFSMSKIAESLGIKLK